MRGLRSGDRVTVTLIGSSSVESGAPLARLLTTRIPGLQVQGARGSSVSTWLREPLGFRGRVLVYLPGQSRGATAGEVRALDAALRRTADDVMWMMPPRFPTIERERVVGATALALAEVGVKLARQGRFELSARGHVAADGVHLTADGATAYGEWLLEAPSPAGIAAAAALLGLGAWLLS